MASRAGIRPLAPKFWAKVDKSGECWLWTGSTDTKGYGQIRHDYKLRGAHRVSYELAHGVTLTPRQKLDHRCNTPLCVKPEHLRDGTQKQNMENLLGPHRDSLTGVRGVSWCKNRKKWRARVGHNYQEHVAGYFDSIAEAEQAVIALRNELFTHNDRDR